MCLSVCVLVKQTSESNLNLVKTSGHTFTQLSEVCLCGCSFAMTGLLSVFSLLPVQTLKKQTHDEGEVEEEEDPGGLEVKESYAQTLSSPSQDITESSPLDVER